LSKRLPGLLLRLLVLSALVDLMNLYQIIFLMSSCHH